MKKMKKFLGALAVMAMVISLVIPVQAAPQEYTYKIRVFAGKQGTFAADGSQEMDYTGRTFDLDDIKVEPATAEDGSEYQKYYVKGIKPSGSDLEENLVNPSFANVNSDMDYVVVYGIRGIMAKYTVNYVDADGNVLAQSRDYEGNVGDKPIVPYLYIEGYMPQAYSLTKTLAEDKEQNVFTFRYTPVPVGGGGDTIVYDEEIVNVTNPNAAVVVPGEEAGDAGAGAAVVPGGAGAEAGGADVGAGVDSGAVAEPQELIDLDDEEVPLANVPGSNGSGFGIGREPGSFFVNMPPAVIVGIVSMAVLVVAAAWFLLFKREKKGTDKDE